MCVCVLAREEETSRNQSATLAVLKVACVPKSFFCVCFVFLHLRWDKALGILQKMREVRAKMPV